MSNRCPLGQLAICWHCVDTYAFCFRILHQSQNEAPVCGLQEKEMEEERKPLQETHTKYVSQAMRKCVMPYANNKGADQPAHPRSLISAFVVRCQDRMVYSLYIRNFKILAGLCSWAGQFGSCLVGDSRRHTLSWRGSCYSILSYLFGICWCFHAIPKNLKIQTMKKLIILKLNNVDLIYSNVSKRCRHNGKQWRP